MTDTDIHSPEGLSSVYIELASKCNLKCKMCSHPTNQRAPHFMSVEHFKGIIDKLLPTPIRRLLLNMGEPLMNKAIFEMVAYAKQHSFFVYISSNGQLMDEECINNILQSGVDAFKFSIEGCSREVYKKIRIGGSFDHLFRNVARLKELRDRSQSNLYIWISTILMKDNENIVDFIKFWGPYCDDIEVCSISDHIGLVEEVREFSMSGKWQQRKSCPQINPYKNISVLSNGDVVICCVDFHTLCKLGNIVEDDFNHIWGSAKMTAIRENANAGTLQNIDPCRNCNLSELSHVFRERLQTTVSFIQRLLKKKDWHALQSIQYVAGSGSTCSCCDDPLLISFDGLCFQCLKKAPAGRRFFWKETKKIMIAGDSFALPRPFKMNNAIELHYENCYPVVLRKLLADYFINDEIILIDNSKRTNTSLGILHDLSNPGFGEIYLSQPDYLVVQVGNVEVFERGKHHDEFAPFIEFRGKNPWVSDKEFVHYIGGIIKETLRLVPGLRGIIIVNILPIEKSENKKIIATRKRIALYNRKLKEFNRFDNIHVLDAYRLFFKAQENPLATDGIHPNKYG
ncbi:MAG: radical SAM protein, partial [bacterium]|nr:radical SAM protein [bacterium]